MATKPKYYLPDDHPLARERASLIAHWTGGEPARTRLHEAAEKGELKRVPRQVFNAETLAAGVKGYTVLMVAAQHGHLDQLPPELLTEKAICTQIPTGSAPIHAAAEHGQLDCIPSPNLNVRSLTLKGHLGNTPTHVAAAHGNLVQIPAKEKTPIIFRARNANQDTVYHVAARHGHFRQIPADMVTPAALVAKNRANEIPLRLIPAKELGKVVSEDVLFSPDVLAVPNTQGEDSYVLECWEKGLLKPGLAVAMTPDEVREGLRNLKQPTKRSLLSEVPTPAPVMTPA